MVGWHHRLNGHEFDWNPGVGDGQGGLVCCSPWGRKSRTWLSDWTEPNWIDTYLWYQNSVLVNQPYPILCNPMDCSTPGFPVGHQLLELTQTHVHWVSDAIQPSHPVFPFSSCLPSFPASGSFQMSQFFASGGQSIGASASASVHPMNIQDWFPLGWTGLISLLSKGLSRVFSNTTVQKH